MPDPLFTVLTLVSRENLFRGRMISMHGPRMGIARELLEPDAKE